MTLLDRSIAVTLVIFAVAAGGSVAIGRIRAHAEDALLWRQKYHAKDSTEKVWTRVAQATAALNDSLKRVQAVQTQALAVATRQRTVAVGEYRTLRARFDSALNAPTPDSTTPAAVPVTEVREVLASADSAIATAQQAADACETTLLTCTQRAEAAEAGNVARDSVIAAQAAKLTMAPKPPGKWKRLGQNVGIVALAVGSFLLGAAK